MCKISVIVPVFNAEKFLDISINSILNQSFKDIEIICVDDGSTDRTPELLEEFQKKDNRIIILRQQNGYAGSARNLGMSVAQGKYLSFLDADDYFKPDMLQKAYGCAEASRADIIVFGGEQFREDIKSIEPFPALLRENLLPELTENCFDNKKKSENLLSFTNPAPWNKLFRKDFILKHRLQFQGYKRFNDAYFVVMALVLAEKIGVIRENMVLYRTGNHQSLQGSNDEMSTQFINVFSDIKNKLIELGLYGQVKKCFQKISLSTCIYVLESLSDAKAFETLYLRLQQEVFDNFDITGSLEDDYYNKYAYRQYRYIACHTPMEYLMDNCINKQDPIYLFPFMRVKKQSKIILYGAGKVGRIFYRQIKKTNYCQIIEWIDKSEVMYDGYRISKPEKADWTCADHIVIAIEKTNVAKEIQKRLSEEFHVETAKIVWESPIL